jgi:uncharacterized protein
MEVSVERILGLIALGFGTGLYGTLIGAGGGFVLMPVLLLLYPTEKPQILTSISLAVVFFNALSGSETYALMRRIDYRAGLMFAVATIPGAVLGALNTAYIPRHLFNLIFGVLLLVCAVFLFLQPGLKHKAVEGQGRHDGHEIVHSLREADGTMYTYTFNPYLGVGLSFFVGYLSSFLGIGGGIVHVPALVYFLNFPVHIATATSHFILAIMAFTGTTAHILTGSFSHGTIRTLSMGIGVVLGAPLGAHLSTRMRGTWIVRSLAFALGLVGIRILLLLLEGRS